MADWFNITEAMTDPFAPGTSELWKAWWKNPIAIAEGAAGAPKIARYIRGGSGATITFAGVDAFSGVIADLAVKIGTPGTTIVSVSFSDDGTTFYGSTVLISSSLSGDLHDVKFWVDFSTGAYGAATRTVVPGYASGIIAGVSAAVVAVRFETTGAGSDTSVTIEPNGGII